MYEINACCPCGSLNLNCKIYTFQLPEANAPAGHNRNSPLVPLFPRVFATDLFRDSRELGYDYDTFEQPPEISLGLYLAFTIICM